MSRDVEPKERSSQSAQARLWKVYVSGKLRAVYAVIRDPDGDRTIVSREAWLGH